jgi:hypothetical protein
MRKAIFSDIQRRSMLVTLLFVAFSTIFNVPVLFMASAAVSPPLKALSINNEALFAGLVYGMAFSINLAAFVCCAAIMLTILRRASPETRDSAVNYLGIACAFFPLLMIALGWYTLP